MKIKHIALTTLLAVSSIAAHADIDKSSAHLTWTGFVKIIPGDAYTITAKDGSMDLKDGTLDLNTNGTFTSSPIVLEGHKYTKDSADNMLIGDFAAASWTLDAGSISMDWGSNTEAAESVTPNIKLIDKNTGIDLTASGAAVPDAEVVDLIVKNDTPATAPAVNLAEQATVKATVIASFDTTEG
ncbi:hypothetical protein [Photobacterium damselae]|uniref:hypothetical protein n=1 Tax=Photobacterium damselae TaxID=38293 RepID=UPI001EFC82F9|nr:hypothetical protein [Photobacterium damselae]MCG9778830.1 hypothetical protein [Photobacterium damselae]